MFLSLIFTEACGIIQMERRFKLFEGNNFGGHSEMVSKIMAKLQNLIIKI
jgi:hypothetical protein